MIEPLSRRALLRGAGAAIALPYLEAMLPRRASSPRERALRFAFVYVPNGVHVPDWTPASEGRLGELPPTLAALAPHRESLLVLSGLTHDKARANGDGPGDHARAAAAFLTASQPFKTGGAGIRAGLSVDQLLAREIGGATKLSSLELGCEAGRQSGECDSGYSCAYSSSISWSGPSTPCGKETDPRLAFDRLFGDPDAALTETERREKRRTRRSVLDLAEEDARRLAARLSGPDRAKLDEYLTGVRELERRIERAARENGGDAVRAQRPGAPDGYQARANAMADLLALAFETDATRVATFMLGDEGSNRSYAEIGVAEGHHELSHHGGDAEKQRKIAAINRFHAAVLARLLDRLAAATDADERVLERSIVVYGSGISDGNAHNHDELPILVAGGGGGLVRGGRHVRHPRETPCANLWVTLLGLAGIEVASFGDSTGALVGLGG